jgi:hypothetical protein
MRRMTMNCMFAAAALAAAATSAPAQTLKAEIPFSFHANRAQMAPGAYEMKVDRDSRYVRLLHTESGKAALLLYTSEELLPAKRWTGRRPRLRFDCAGARCVLRQLWPGADSGPFAFAGPDFGPNEAIRTAEIALTKVKGE